jgi:hypothetical protein
MWYHFGVETNYLFSISEIQMLGMRYVQCCEVIVRLVSSYCMLCSISYLTMVEFTPYNTEAPRLMEFTQFN